MASYICGSMICKGWLHNAGIILYATELGYRYILNIIVYESCANKKIEQVDFYSHFVSCLVHSILMFL